MTQDHKVPTQFEVDNYIAQAKSLRTQALATLCKRFFHLPTEVMEHFSTDRSAKKHVNEIYANKAL